MAGRGVISDKWSMRILWSCAIGSAIGLYMVAQERQMQNREKMLAEALKDVESASAGGGDEDAPADDIVAVDGKLRGKDKAWSSRGVASGHGTAAGAGVGMAAGSRTAVGAGWGFGMGKGDGMADPGISVGEGYGSGQVYGSGSSGQGYGLAPGGGEGYGWGEGYGSDSGGGEGYGWGEGRGSGYGGGEGYGQGEGIGGGFGQGVGPGYYGPGGSGSGGGGGQGDWDGGFPSGRGGGGGGYMPGGGIGYPGAGCCSCGMNHFPVPSFGIPFPGFHYHEDAVQGPFGVANNQDMRQRNVLAPSMTMFADEPMPPTSSEIPAHMNSAVDEELHM